MPKLPRTWYRNSANANGVRDAAIPGPILDEGVTITRLVFRYRIMGRRNESEFYSDFDAYYVGVLALPTFIGTPSANLAWAGRATEDWLFWEGQHYRVTFGVGTPGRAHLMYPFGDNIREVHGQRLLPLNGQVWFIISKSGGTALDDARFNVNWDLLTLG